MNPGCARVTLNQVKIWELILGTTATPQLQITVLSYEFVSRLLTLKGDVCYFTPEAGDAGDPCFIFS